MKGKDTRIKGYKNDRMQEDKDVTIERYKNNRILG